MESPAFIVALRGFIRKGRRADVHGNDEQFLDSVAFWRNAYEKSQEVEQQLRARIQGLEQRLETISGTSGQTTLSTDTSQRKRKRKNPTVETRSGGRATKMAKTTKATAVSQSNGVNSVLANQDLDFDVEDAECKQVFQVLSRKQSLILY